MDALNSSDTFPLITPIRIPVSDIVLSLSRHIDMVHPDLKDHHRLTARIALEVGRSAGYPDIELRRLYLAALLHDAGTMQLRERLDIMAFDADVGRARPMRHAEAAYVLLVGIPHLRPLARIIRHHHVHWASRGAWEGRHGPIPAACHLLHLADRIAVLIDGGRSILNQVPRILSLIRSGAGTMFSPEAVAAFVHTAQREAFWLGITDPETDNSQTNPAGATWIDMERSDLDDLAKLFCRIIDFKSPYTALHSSGVAGTAEGLALKAGLSPERAFLLRIAGYLHDAGKVSVPTDVLEKHGTLTEEEFNLVKGHAYFTGRILRGLRELGPIRQWAALHHERPDGNGYPFRLGGTDLPFEARLVAAADIYMALREDRPQRPAYGAVPALRLMDSMARNGAVDPDLTQILAREHEFVDRFQAAALEEARVQHDRLDRSLGRRFQVADPPPSTALSV